MIYTVCFSVYFYVGPENYVSRSLMVFSHSGGYVIRFYYSFILVKAAFSNLYAWTH